jgi:hypothetical protein
MRMPWQIADALYDDLRRKTFKEILDAGLDLQNQQLVTSSTHGVGDLQLILADKARLPAGDFRTSSVCDRVAFAR